jgi:dolichol-phosphate mannosyltransferase
MPPLISVVMPAHNERESLRGVVQGVVTALGDRSHEVIVVDDGSTDGTWTELLRIRDEQPSVQGIRLTRNFGHQAAPSAGLRAARGTAVVTMDADGEHPPALLPVLVERRERGAPVVQTVRLPSGHEGRLKRMTSRWFYAVWSAVSGVQLVRVPPTSDWSIEGFSTGCSTPEDH